MTRYLLDTNVIAHLVNKSTGYELIEERLSQTRPDRLFVSVITVWEIYRMRAKAELKHKVSTRASRALVAALELFTPVDLDEQKAALGGGIHALLSHSGATIGERDSMIAATAISNKLVMVTDNLGEFYRVPGITLENWRNPGALADFT